MVYCYSNTNTCSIGNKQTLRYHHPKFKKTTLDLIKNDYDPPVQRNVSTIEHFAAMESSERRLLVRSLSDEEYLDMMAVCAGFPHVDITTEIQGRWNWVCLQWYSLACPDPLGVRVHVPDWLPLKDGIARQCLIEYTQACL